jgi:hypothetical protein
MSVPTKPTESLDWAESGTPPSAPGSTLPSEPSTGRKASGYGFEDPIPHSEFNWLMRTLNRWLNWVTEKMDLHVHDGGTNPESVSKINLKDHIGWGTNGALEVTSDTGAEHRIEHTGGATLKKIKTQRFEGVSLTLSSFATITGNATVSGNLTAPQVPRALGTMKGSDGTFIRNYGFDPASGRTGVGEYVLTFDGLNPALSKMVCVASLSDLTKNGFTIQAEPIDSLGIRTFNVATRNASGTLADCDFSITGYVLP